MKPVQQGWRYTELIEKQGNPYAAKIDDHSVTTKTAY